ncbi:MAG: hypothetical protein Q8P41_27130 [Pseudomonadota bacterium]|nr:hypothetical protein [Pseudomonadota bacterium]
MAYAHAVVAAPNPEAFVQRKATQHDRQLARQVDHLEADDRYFVALEDALAVASDVLSESFIVAEVTGHGVGTDWRLEVEAGTEEDGEWVKQTRSRITIELAGKPEILVTMRATAEERTFHAGKPEPAWASVAPPKSVTQAVKERLAQRLAALESDWLGHVRMNLGPADLRQYVDAALPPGWTVSDVAGGVAIETTARVSDENERKKLSATWERRARVTVTPLGPKPPHGVTFRVTEENRFITQEGEGAWAPADVVDPRPLEKLRRDILVAASDYFEFPAATRPMPALAQKGLSEPPPIPPLRTAAQLEKEDSERQRIADQAAASGWYRLRLMSVVPNPTRAGGRTWDASFTEVGRATGKLVATSAAASGTGIDVNAAGDLGAELGASMPTDPDMAGRITIGQQIWPLPEVFDSLSPSWGWVATVPIEGNAPTVGLLFEDVDLASNDAVGSCRVTLREILDGGGTATVACGEATVTINAEWMRGL